MMPWHGVCSTIAAICLADLVLQPAGGRKETICGRWVVGKTGVMLAAVTFSRGVHSLDLFGFLKSATSEIRTVSEISFV